MAKQTKEVKPTEGPEKNAAPPEAKAGKEAKRAAVKPPSFTLDKRKFELLVKSLFIPGRGKFTAEEVAADGTLQQFLVARLDANGSGVIKEIF